MGKLTSKLLNTLGINTNEEDDFEEYEVGEGEIFFLGDNRQNSLDSRYKEEYGGSHLSNGLYKAEDIYGVVPDWAIAYKTPLEWLFFRNI